MDKKKRLVKTGVLCILVLLLTGLLGCGKAETEEAITQLFDEYDEDWTTEQVEKVLGTTAEVETRERNGYTTYTYYQINFMGLDGTVTMGSTNDEPIDYYYWAYIPVGTDTTENHTTEIQNIYDYFFDLYGSPSEESHSYSDYYWQTSGKTFNLVVDEDIVKVNVSLKSNK
jgi:hypothetical protein